MMCTGSDTPSSTHLNRPMANCSCGVMKCSTSKLRALAASRLSDVVGVRADQAEREVEVAEDLRRVDGDVALGVDRRAEVLQRKRRRRRVLRARGSAVEQDQPQDQEDCAAPRS